MTAGLLDLADSRAFADRLTAEMTLVEKAAQLAQVEKNSITPEEVARWGIGSVLSGGGGNPDPNTPANWKAMVQPYLDGARRSRLGIPLLYGTDAVHGHSNVKGATIFPHNIGLGATGDPDLVEQVHRATAVETAATGARWAFAPTVAVALDPRWGRTYESFGDDPTLVAELGAAAVRGLQRGGSGRPGADAVVACLKHFVGDGGTTWGSAPSLEWIDWWEGWRPAWRIDQGDARFDEATLRSVHLPAYRAGLEAGALTVMASYHSWNGEKLHGHRYLLTEVLKEELGFGGFVVSDWLAIDQLDPDPYRGTILAIEAGVDMVMVPFETRRFIDDVTKAVEVGDLSPDRVDDAVARVLTVKHALGLFAPEQPAPPDIESVGCPEHRRLARRAVAASVVRLTDQDRVLPVTAGPMLVAGPGADDIGLQCGGWTIEWQGGTGPITTGTTILDGLRDSPLDLEVAYRADGRFPEGLRAPVGVVVVAEPPYSEGGGDRADLALPAEDVELVGRVRERVERLVLVVLSGRPLLVGAVADQCDAIVAAWLPGSEGAGVAEVLTGARPFTGRLPRTWPEDATHVDDRDKGGTPQWQRGHGLIS